MSATHAPGGDQMLNKKDFVMLGGDPSVWDLESMYRQDSMDLVENQRVQHSQGRRSAILVHGIHGWYVRSASGLDNNRIMLPMTGHTQEQAIAWGRAWAENDPKNREFFCRRSHIECPCGTLFADDNAECVPHLASREAINIDVKQTLALAADLMGIARGILNKP